MRAEGYTPCVQYTPYYASFFYDFDLVVRAKMVTRMAFEIVGRRGYLLTLP
jgi:hypothetical protein